MEQEATHDPFSAKRAGSRQEVQWVLAVSQEVQETSQAWQTPEAFPKKPVGQSERHSLVEESRKDPGLQAVHSKGELSQVRQFEEHAMHLFEASDKNRPDSQLVQWREDSSFEQVRQV